MSSTDIYTPITPTYLYIKQHAITGLKYFGKTTQDPYSYNGSGKHWSRHIKKHGVEHVKTLWVSSSPYTDTNIVNVALALSEMYDIVDSDAWANMKPENGLDGGFTSENARKRVADGTHNLLGGKIGGDNARKRVADGTHNLLGGDNARKRVADGTHNLLGGETNRKRIENGTHNLLGGTTCRDRSGKVVQVPKEEYHSQSGDKSDWEFAHINSKEGKRRKLQWQK